MKKLIALLIICTVAATAFGQTVSKKKDKEKVERTSTVPQKAHNLFSRHKHYNGYKIKHKKKVEKI